MAAVTAAARQPSLLAALARGLPIPDSPLPDLIPVPFKAALKLPFSLVDPFHMPAPSKPKLHKDALPLKAAALKRPREDPALPDPFHIPAPLRSKPKVKRPREGPALPGPSLIPAPLRSKPKVRKGALPLRAAAAKRPREDPALTMLAARLAATPSPTLARVLAAALGGPASVMALLPQATAQAKVAQLEKASRAISKAAHCYYSTKNLFSLRRAAPVIAALHRLLKEQSLAVRAAKDAAAAAEWATAALGVARGLYRFDKGLTDYIRVAKGIVGKAAAAALQGAWGKGASAAVKDALTAAAVHAPKA